ncbi:hypothetical protein GUITHDRAFT_138238 [Guillardia theta CCMP2712]|uniref:SET domain-containing protein n=1 Tax=Guillardia theta (strain CCMP2712) TaxID=905079 RepID=L1JDV8_GUITC|nr:hypothetical protein GUITHDRAFT_138238 [Guillardia theta CCMP2712]EKX46502.1 hypothetical protein GUITHDRAFT_138238 [Guillardia theta CCMP2712]|eukprot:XP_005833482.1 hypothetical protein GUITHDRAFT_138238 [Guillardia theta CCMP2712]
MLQGRWKFHAPLLSSSSSLLLSLLSLLLLPIALLSDPPDLDALSFDPPVGSIIRSESVEVLVKAQEVYKGREDGQGWRWTLTINDMHSRGLGMSAEQASMSLSLRHVGEGELKLTFTLTVEEDVHVSRSAFYIIKKRSQEEEEEGEGEAEGEEGRDADSTCGPSSEQERREKLLEWAREHGIGFEKISLQEDEFGGTAMFASEDLEEDEVIGVVPFSISIGRESLWRSRHGELLGQLYEDERTPPDLISCIFLLLERRSSSSFFRPYLDMLPTPSGVSNVFHWDAHALSAFSPHEEARSLAAAHLSLFERTYQRYFTVVNKNEEFQRQFGKHQEIFSRDQVLWAYSLLISRAWEHPDYNYRTSFHRMLPIADIANHKMSPTGSGWMSVEFRNQQGAVFLVTRGGAIRRGQEIVTSYSNAGNALLLVQYGFSLWPNKYHCLRLQEEGGEAGGAGAGAGAGGAGAGAGAGNFIALMAASPLGLCFDPE